MKKNYQLIFFLIFTFVFSSTLVQGAEKLTFTGKSLILKANPEAYIKITHSQGNIEIRQWDNEEIKIELSNQQEIHYQVNKTTNTFEFEAFSPVNYLLFVPKNSKADINLASGDVKVISLANVVINNANGSVHLENISGSVSVENYNGSLYMQNIKGKIKTDTSNGNVTLENIMNDSEVKATNGHIKIIVSSERRIELKASALNGSITTPTSKKESELSTILGDKNGKPLQLRLETINGDIEVKFNEKI